MRIDSLTYFSASLAGMRDNQAAIARLNQQIASGKSLLAPKDDPLATERILDLSNRVAARAQFTANQDMAEVALKYENTVVQEIHNVLTQARGLLAGAIGSQDTILLNVHAQQLRGVFNHLLGLVNTRNPSGDYIFSGFNTTTQPFANAGNGAATTYAGTPSPGGTRNIEIEVGRQVQVNDNIYSVFKFVDATLGDTADPTADPGNLAYVAGTEHDLLRNLGHAVANLGSGTLTTTDINKYVALVDAAMARLDLVEHRIAGALTEVIDTRATTKAQMVQETNALGDLQQVDQAAAIMELKVRQTTLEAASNAYARTSGLSLFSYL
jgi:flagellar hook-associated protein 3 FlgL